jgi:hypothetical protein
MWYNRDEINQSNISMYTPKISEELIPVLYLLAASKKQPMTKLVDSIVREHLSMNNITLQSLRASISNS